MYSLLYAILLHLMWILYKFVKYNQGSNNIHCTIEQQYMNCFSNSSQNDAIKESDHQNAESASQVRNNKLLAVGRQMRFLDFVRIYLFSPLRKTLTRKTLFHIILNQRILHVVITKILYFLDKINARNSLFFFFL